MISDRLPEEFWSDEELDQFAAEVLGQKTIYTEVVDGLICAYKLWVNGLDSGKIMLLLVEETEDGLWSINHSWGKYGFQAELVNCTRGNTLQLHAMYTVMQKERYVGKHRIDGWDRVFNYVEWIKGMLSEKTL